MPLIEVIGLVYLGLGAVWLVWFRIQKSQFDSTVDALWIIPLNSPLVQVLLIPLWPILLVLTWPKK